MKVYLAEVLHSTGTLISAAGKLAVDTATMYAAAFYQLADSLSSPLSRFEEPEPFEPEPFMPRVAIAPRVRYGRMGIEPMPLEPNGEGEVVIRSQVHFRPKHMVLSGMPALDGVAITYLRVDEHHIVEPEHAMPASAFAKDTVGSSFLWPALKPGSLLTMRYKNYGTEPVTVLGTLLGLDRVEFEP